MARFVEQGAVVRRAEAELLHQAAQLEKDGAAVEFGYGGSMTRMLQDMLRIGKAEARRMVDRAHALFGSLGISGEPIPADLHNTADTYLRGELGGEHVDRIRRFATELPVDVLTNDAWPIAENALAEIASDTGPYGLTRPIREFRARLDPDGQPPDDREPARPDRQIWLEQWQNNWTIRGTLDYETGLKLRSVFDALGKPRSTEANGGTPDMRTKAERDADALADVIQLAANPENLPGNGGEPFAIMVTMSEQALREGIGTATTMDGTEIPATQLRRIACEAGIIPTVLGSDGEVLDMGCRERTAPPKLRRRLIARDRGCAHPDCDRPPALTEAHHIQHYADGGYTIEENMVLLCRQHHSLIHGTAWQVRIRNGKPEFTPPEYRTRPAVKPPGFDRQVITCLSSGRGDHGPPTAPG